jgi:hypothetical protein
MRAEPPVTGQTVTPAAMPTVMSGKAGMPHKTVVPAVMSEPVVVEAVMIEATMVEAVMVEAATPVPETPPIVIISIVAMPVGASGQGKNHADQERYKPPHRCAAIHRNLCSIADWI